MGKRGWRRVGGGEGVGTSPQGLLFFLWHIWYLYHSIVLIAMFFSYTGNITGYGK